MTDAPAAEIKLLSSLATMAAIQDLAPEIEKAAKVKFVAEFGPTVGLVQRIRAGEKADLAIITDPAIDALIGENILDAAGRTNIAVSLVGMAVRAGAPKPDIGSVDALKRTLLDAGSVAYSQIGASGIFFAELLQRLGLVEALGSRAIVVPKGLTGELVVRGEAELAIQQISELMAVPGVDIVGPLPQGADSVTPFSVAVFAGCRHPAQARDIVGLLTSPRAAQAYRKSGLEPLAAQR